MLVSSPDKISLVLAHRDDKRNGEVSWWHSTNGGTSFTKGKTLIARKKTGFAISSIIRNAHPDARYLAAGMTGQTDFTTMYLLGDRGPLQRSKAQADQLSVADKTKPKKKKKKMKEKE